MPPKIADASAQDMLSDRIAALNAASRACTIGAFLVQAFSWAVIARRRLLAPDFIAVTPVRCAVEACMPGLFVNNWWPIKKCAYGECWS